MNNNLLNYGEIYCITNLTNNKKYIGQAVKYMGSNKQKWGTEGRWSSHIREAINNKNDHCSTLNSAIRKYGVDNFKVEKLCDCLITELDDMEKKYITEHNTMADNNMGYNLTEGGAKGKDSQETIQKKIKAQTGKKHSDTTKQSISQGQLGNKREKKFRKYEEDNNLPKYISANRKKYKDENGQEYMKINSYYVSAFPIGIDKVEYAPNKSFKLLDDAIKYLDELKKKYSFEEEKIAIIKTEKQKEKIVEKKEHQLLDKLPDNIFPILNEDAKLIGYKVKNLIDKKNQKIPERDFINRETNKWNRDDAERYLEDINDIINNDKYIYENDWKYVEPNKRQKINDKEFYIPPYMNISNHGFKIQGIPMCDENNKPILDTNGHKKNSPEKKFTKQGIKNGKPTISRLDRYNLAFKYLLETKKKI